MNTPTKTIPELAAEEARLWEAVKAANNSYENARNIWHPVRVALDKAIADAEAEQRILARMAAEKEAAK